MSKIKLLVTDNGITADGKGVLPGSVLVVKGEVVPPAWNGVAKILVGDDRQLIGDNASQEEIEELAKKVDELRGQLGERDKVISEAQAVNGSLQTENDALKKQRQEDAEYALIEAQEKFKALAGKDADKRWSIETLREEIAKLEAK